MQVTLQSLHHQAYLTGLQRIPSLCCLQPPYWHAPGARAFYNASGSAQARHVVMVFTCFADFQGIFKPGGQRAAEAIVTLYKACVHLALAFEDGYECQEVRAVYHESACASPYHSCAVFLPLSLAR